MYVKMRVGVWFNTEIRFIEEVSKNDQWKEHNLFGKTIHIRFSSFHMPAAGI